MAHTRGEKVILRAFEGKPLVRVMWNVLEDSVLVTNESGLASLEYGHGAMPIGFQFSDVFVYEEKMAKRLMRRYENGQILEWKRLTPYKGKN